MELDDGAFPLLQGIVATTDPVTAFRGVDVVILVGAFPRQKGMLLSASTKELGMERKDLLQKNAAIFKNQGALLEQYASKTVKVRKETSPTHNFVGVSCWQSSQHELSYRF